MQDADDELDSSPDADTVVLFPDFPDHKVVLGSKIDALIGFTNSGSRKFNVTRVWGSLHSALGYQFLLQACRQLATACAVSCRLAGSIGGANRAGAPAREYEGAIYSKAYNQAARMGLCRTTLSPSRSRL